MLATHPNDLQGTEPLVILQLRGPEDVYQPLVARSANRLLSSPRARPMVAVLLLSPLFETSVVSRPV